MRLPLVLTLIALTSACGRQEDPAAAGSTTPAPARGIREDIDVATLKERLAQPGAVLIDVRSPEEYRASHVPGARNIPIDELAGRLSEIPKDGPVNVICQVGGRSSKATDQLIEAGYPKVANVKGGTAAWIHGSNPIEGGDGPAASPSGTAASAALESTPAQAEGATPAPAGATSSTH